jgi:hypothetical protein
MSVIATFEGEAGLQDLCCSTRNDNYIVTVENSTDLWYLHEIGRRVEGLELPEVHNHDEASTPSSQGSSSDDYRLYDQHTPWGFEGEDEDDDEDDDDDGEEDVDADDFFEVDEEDDDGFGY